MIAVRTLAGLLLPLGALFAITAPDVAVAASPSYCALYAREYANGTVQASAAPGMLQSVQDQAYYRCLNQDDEPPLPKASAYFGTDVIDGTAAVPGPKKPAVADPTIAATPTPIVPPQPKLAPTRSVASASSGSDRSNSTPTTPVVNTPVPATPTPAATAQPKAAPTTTIASATTYRSNYHGSGMTPWTPEWKSWCARNFPNSWDPATGTILNYGADRRELCR